MSSPQMMTMLGLSAANAGLAIKARPTTITASTMYHFRFHVLLLVRMLFSTEIRGMFLSSRVLGQGQRV